MKKAAVAALLVAVLLATTAFPMLDAAEGNDPIFNADSKNDILDIVTRAIADTSAVLELTSDYEENKKILMEKLNEILKPILPSFTIDERNFDALASLIAGFAPSKLVASHFLPDGDPTFSKGHLNAGFDLPQPLRDAFNIEDRKEGSDSRYGELGVNLSDTISVNATTFRDIDHVGGMSWAGSFLNDYNGVIFRLLKADNPDVLLGKDLGDKIIKKDSVYRVDTALSASIYIGMNAEYDEENDVLDVRMIFKGSGSIDERMDLIEGQGPDYIETNTVAREILVDMNLTMINPSSPNRTLYFGLNDFNLDFYYGMAIDDVYESTEIRASGLTAVFKGMIVRVIGDEVIDYQNKLDYDQNLINTASEGRSEAMNKLIAEARGNTHFEDDSDSTLTIVTGIVLAVLGVAILLVPRFMKRS